MTANLELAETRELINELKRRVRHLVVAFEQEEKVGSKLGVSVEWSGGIMGAMGLCRWAEMRISSNLAFQPPDEEDDSE